MSKFLVIGDVHLTDPKNAPSVRSEKYTEQILAKLQWLVSQAKEKGCEGVVQLGDLFHIKTPSRSSHRLVQQTHEVLTSEGVPVILTVGNHDIQNDRLDSLDAQPLGALGRMDGCEILVGAHDIFPLFAIPYLQDWQTLPAYIEQFHEARDDKAWMLTMHAPIFPAGQEPPYDYISASSISRLVSDGRPTTVAYGHIHDPHGVHGVPDSEVEFVNMGAISRGSLHIETLKRKPQAYIWDTVADDYEVLDIPHLPIEDVFPMQTVVAEKARAAGMADFLAGVGSGSVDATDVASVLKAAKEAELSPEVEALVVELLATDV